MAVILIVDDDLGLQKILELSLQKYRDDFIVLFAADGKKAISILEQHQIDLLVTDIKMPNVDGLALLSHMSVNYPRTPCIVLTSYTIPGLEKRLSPSIFHFLKKPVNPEKLAGLIKDGLQEAGKGEGLTGISVPGVMQIIETEQKTCFLVLHADGKRQGAMYFHEGVLYDAVCGTLHAEDAALQLIALENAQLEYRKLPATKIPQHIKKGIQALLLEAMRLKDEDAAIEEVPELYDDLMMEGIQLCEALHFQKAQRLFLQIASKDVDNVPALMWLSRTVSSMKQLRVALRKAYELNPNDQDVTRDIQKFSAASKIGLEKMRRCPFCYAPIAEQATHCHFCGAFFAVNAEILPRLSEKVDNKAMRLALDRFENVLARELNVPVLFYTVLACLHLDDIDSALEYLEQLQECIEPGDAVYSETVEHILTFIASKQSGAEVADTINAEVPVSVPPKVSDQQKILVVEDSQTTRKVIKMTLQANGYKVVEARDGVEALTKINDEQPDLILLDVMLPKLDGYSILTILKQNNAVKKVPVIMLTSKDGLKDRIRGRFSSASAYLTKPFKPELLLKKIEQFI